MPHSKKCSAPACDEYANDLSTTALFRFPSDTARCRKWVQNCGNRNLLTLPVKKLHTVRYLCKKHFEPKYFWDKFHRKLHRNAVPTIFKGKPLTDVEMASFDAMECEKVDAGQESSVKSGKPEEEPFIEAVFSIPGPSTIQSGLSPESLLQKRKRRNDEYLHEEGDAEIVLFVLEEEEEEEEASPNDIPVGAVAQNKQSTLVKESSLSRPQQLETSTPLAVTSSFGTTAQNTRDQTGAENSCKESPCLNKASPCHSNISQSRITLCEREMELIEKKYRYEIELINMKKETQRLKQEALREKLLFYKEKRKRIAYDS